MTTLSLHVFQLAVGQEIPDELQHVGPMPALSADSCPMWSAKPTPVPGPIWDMVQYDAMHTFAGDSKAYMFNILGIAPHKKAMVIPYDAAVNKRHGAPWIARECYGFSGCTIASVRLYQTSWPPICAPEFCLGMLIGISQNEWGNSSYMNRKD